jgi:hypothetical protein
MTDYAEQAGRLQSSFASEPVAPAAPAPTAAPEPTPSMSPADRAIADAEVAYALSLGRPNSLRSEFRMKQAEIAAIPVAERTPAEREIDLQLTRGQVAGAGEPLGPPDEPDVDVPMRVDGYRIPNSVTSAEMREVVDKGHEIALPYGIGVQKVFDFTAHAITGGYSRDEAKDWTVLAGWPDAHIEAVHKFYDWLEARK